MRYKSLGEMFFTVCEERKDHPAYMFKKEGYYQSISFSEAAQIVKQIAGGLASIGVKHGNKVALLSENRLEWALTDYAILSLGAITVPIYPSLLPNQVEYILKDSGSMVVICSNKQAFSKVGNVQVNCPELKSVVVIDIDEGNLSFNQLKEHGDEFIKKNPEYISEQIKSIKTDEMATIIYTSGTTGEPKGAMLTHGNFISNIEGSLEYLEVKDDDIFLSFLPLCHVLERMAGHFLKSYCGCTVAFAESIDTVAENMREVRPMVMISVPRLYEKIYARVLESVESGSGLKRKIFYWAVGVGREYVDCIMNKTPISGSLQFKRNLAFKLVFGKLAERVGGRLRFFVSGGAPLAKEIAEFFAAAGLMVYEGYGLTETSPVIAVNSENKFKFGTVGPVLKNIEVKIADDGEILTRGPHVMIGYYNKEEETKESIDNEGWFYTGDIGFIDNDGFLAITDRKKNIIVTSGGKNVAPQPIENKLVTSKYVEQSVIIGDKRKFCTAVIVPAFEVIEKWANENSLSYNDIKDLTSKDEIRALIQNEINEVNNDLASFETIKDFILIDKPFSIETGELTPSLKVKRRVIMEKFGAEIDKMYQV